MEPRDDIETLVARLHVAAEVGRLTRDLADAIVRALRSSSRRRPARVARRDQLLVQAASHLTGTVNARAKRIAEEFKVPTDTEFGRLVAAALAVDTWRGPPSARRLRAILGRVGHRGNSGH